jgi:hypothetical protein
MIVLYFVISLVAGFVGGMWGYRWESSRQQAADKKALQAMADSVSNRHIRHIR